MSIEDEWRTALKAARSNVKSLQAEIRKADAELANLNVALDQIQTARRRLIELLREAQEQVQTLKDMQ